MATIEELKGMASSKLGFARTNNFLVELPQLGSNPFGRLSGFVPSIPGITPDSKPSTRELNILCKNATLPGKQILTSDRRIGMIFEKVADGYAYYRKNAKVDSIDYNPTNTLNVKKKKRE